MEDFSEYEFFLDRGLDIENRIIILGREEDAENGEITVNDCMAIDLYKKMTILERINTKDITVVLNTVGGSDTSMWAIYDMIKVCKCNIIIKVYGTAASAGALILQAANERIMAFNSRLMIHYDNEFGGSKTEKLILDKMYEDTIYEVIIRKNPKFPRQRLKRWLNTETYFSAKQCLELGLIDKIE